MFERPSRLETYFNKEKRGEKRERAQNDEDAKGVYVSEPLEPPILKSYKKFNEIAAARSCTSQAPETLVTCC